MSPHQRQYEVHGKSVNLEKFRIHILDVIENDELTIPQIAEALKTDEDPDKWETLWPASDAPFDGQVESDLNEDGLYPSAFGFDCLTLFG